MKMDPITYKLRMNWEKRQRARIKKNFQEDPRDSKLDNYLNNSVV